MRQILVSAVLLTLTGCVSFGSPGAAPTYVMPAQLSGPRSKGLAATETQFSKDSGFVASLNHIVFGDLEPPGTTTTPADTGSSGVDRYRFAEVVGGERTFTVKRGETGDHTVRLIDSQGRTVASIPANQTTVTVTLAVGTYTLELTHAGGANTATHSVVIQPLTSSFQTKQWGDSNIDLRCNNYGSAEYWKCVERNRAADQAAKQAADQAAQRLLPRVINSVLIHFGTGVDLNHADLYGADLTGCTFTGANLSHANLNNAKVNGADLTGATLDNANLNGADLSNAKLSNAKLPNATLYGATLTNANLNGADLSNTDLTYAQMLGADLTNANLTWANLLNALVAKANLTNANLTNTIFKNTNLNQANLTGTGKEPTIYVGPYVNYTNTNLVKAVWQDYNFTGANFSGANLSDAYVPGANFTGANFTGTNLRNVNMVNANLTGTNFANADLTNANLGGANLDGADLTKVATFYNTNFNNVKKDKLIRTGGFLLPGEPLTQNWSPF